MFDRTTDRSSTAYAILLLRILLGALFIAHLYYKVVVRPGGLTAWWDNLIVSGYAPYVPFYVLSAEIAAAALLIPGILTRWVALYAMPMMAGAAQYWLVRKGFFFTGAGAELPLVWFALLGVQVMLGDGAFAALPSPSVSSLVHRRRGYASRAL